MRIVTVGNEFWSVEFFGRICQNKGNVVCFPDTYLSSPLPIASLRHSIIKKILSSILKKWAIVLTYFELSFTLQFVKIVFFITVVNISSQANQTNISPSEDKSGSQNAPTSGNFIIYFFQS